jgi:N-acetylglucosaminyl-diphospho-decaprenol L-rhamnosyltransferase
VTRHTPPDAVADTPLDAVIISYRCRELLQDCLRSLRDHPPGAGMTVRVIDNASDDGTSEMIRREFPAVGLIVAPRNIGFAAACNVAIRGGTTPYVLCLNPDTRVTPGALDRLLRVMDEHPEVGILGCRLELENGRLDVAAKRSFPTPLSALGHFTGLGRRRSSGILADYRAPDIEWGPVDAVNGAFMLLRRSALEQVGLFDEGYWMYMEDLDLCYRFAQAGWVTWYEPSATVIHVKAGSSGPVRSPRLNYAFHYGMFRFYRKHYSATRSMLVSAAVYAGIAAKLAVSVSRAAVLARRNGHRAIGRARSRSALPAADANVQSSGAGEGANREPSHRQSTQARRARSKRREARGGAGRALSDAAGGRQRPGVLRRRDVQPPDSADPIAPDQAR